MRSCLKLTITGFILGATLLLGALLFPRDWIKPKDESGLAAVLFGVGILAGLASLFALLNIYS